MSAGSIKLTQHAQTRDVNRCAVLRPRAFPLRETPLQEEVAMKKLMFAVFGAAALSLAAVATVEPAQARSNVGVYIGPNGLSISVERYRRCESRWYRRTHAWCSRYYGRGYRYYPSYYHYKRDRWRDRDRHHRHHDRHRDRW
jgi:hypothetical protein